MRRHQMNMSPPNASRIRTVTRKAQALIALSRPVNALLAALSVLAAGAIAGARPSSMPVLLLLACASLLLTASGNSINDAYDAAIDSVNKPKRPVPSGALSTRACILWSALCAGAGLLFSSAGGAVSFIIAASAAALMFAYSAWLKRLPLVGNIVVGAITGAAFFLGATVTPSPGRALIPALFAFVYTVAREIVKDIEDIPGDRSAGHDTFPVRFGADAARTTALFLIALVVGASALPYVTGIYGLPYLGLIGFLDGLLVWAIFLLRRSVDARNMARISAILKAGMPIGILAMWLGTI